MKTIPWCLLIFLLTVTARADDAPKADTSLEIIQYKAPAGWKLAEGNGSPARIYSSPDSNGAQRAMIIIMLTPPQDPLDLAAAFDVAVKQVTSNGKVIEAGDVASTKTRQGFDAVSKTIVTQGAGDEKVFARMIAAKVQNRMAGIYYLATSRDLYDLHQAEMASLLQSVTFNANAGGAVNPLGAGPTAMGATAELAALEKQKQELLARVAEIEARQRVLAGGAAPAARAADATPQEELLAKARDQFIKTVATRKKPHVVSGDILALDGKPIQNVASYHLSVWGTTVAAERTTYSLEVDQNGHYEQQVPDGLYQVEARCIVNQAGHRVPIDLVWLDDKKQGVVQASSDGIVRDFRLVLNGLKPGEDPKSERAFFGGMLRVNGPPYELKRGNFGPRHPGGHVILTLVAQSPLVDGSRMEPITMDMETSDLNYSSNRRNIPVGVYKATAVLVEKDGTKTVLPCASNFNGPFGDSAEIFWESSRDNADQRRDPDVYLKD